MLRSVLLVLALLLPADAQAQCPNGRCPIAPTWTSPVLPVSPPVSYPRGSAWTPAPTYYQQPPRSQTSATNPPLVPYVPGRVYRHQQPPTSTYSRPSRSSQPTAPPITYNGSSQWTYPGNLREHMQEHGLPPREASSLSRIELQQMHDTIHNRKNGSRGQTSGTPDYSDVERYLQ